MTTHHIKASALPLFNTPEFYASSGVLGGDFKSFLGLARSYELLATTDGARIQPRVKVWSKSGFMSWDGRLICAQLGPQKPELSKGHAAASFAFLDWDELRDAAEDRLMEIIPEGRGDAYDLLLTVHGALLIATEWHNVRHHHGAQAVAAAFCAEGLSNHQRVLSSAFLTQFANAVIRMQEQDRPDLQEKRGTFEVSITFD